MSNPVAPRVAVIVVAAGGGVRLGAGVPKAFVPLAGRTLLARSLYSAFGMREPGQVIVVAPATHLAQARAVGAEVAGAASGYLHVVTGGQTRQQSVAAGLAEVRDGVEIVLVHDAARALTPSSLFDAVVAEVRRRGGGVVPGLPVTDTIKRTDAVGRITETVDRSELSAVQTPQGFPREQLLAAYASPAGDFTDDAALVMEAGHPVAVVPGDALAFKITTVWDLRRAEHLLAGGSAASADVGIAVEHRIGIGTDTHAFDATAELWLAGLFWPGEPGLAGHSDGDAVAHAMTDALLAAAGLGDIGSVFGTNDPNLGGAHGDVFLAEARRLIEAAGWCIGNVSVQLVGNRPRFSTRRTEAEALLSGLLGAPVSVSATTTDGLGFTGRGEGVAAIATALLHASAGAASAK